MTDIKYDQLKAQAILGCESAGEIMESLLKVDPKHHAEAREVCQVILLGAQVYATLALAEAEKDSMRELAERAPKRLSRPFNPMAPVRPVTPINKFQKEDGSVDGQDNR